MFMIEYKEFSWWYWLLIACLITFGVFGNPDGFVLAIGLTVVQLIHYVIREGGITQFPVQVRFWYLMLLIVALPEPMQWLFWIPMVGTWAQIIFGYCTMARCVSLMPWNRSERLSFALVKTTFLSCPVRGYIQQGFAVPREIAENA